MIQQYINAWRFIFDHHPRGDEIMNQIMDEPDTITLSTFKKLYREAKGS